MDYHLDALLNLPNLTVESCTQEGQQVFLKLRFLNETSDCPHCQNSSDKLHQNRPVLIRDLPIFEGVSAGEATRPPNLRVSLFIYIYLVASFIALCVNDILLNG